MIHAEKVCTEGPRSTIEDMCHLLEVSRSGYYDWVARRAAGPGPREQRLLDLADKVLTAHEESDGVYEIGRASCRERV